MTQMLFYYTEEILLEDLNLKVVYIGDKEVTRHHISKGFYKRLVL